jgi:hypothetical protein
MAEIAKSGSDQLSITITLDKKRVVVLRRAFPESADLNQVATTIAGLITNEFIDLLAGEKRYISLSHQYIEWIQQLYEAVLPDEEYTYRRLYDRFNFPPGAAAYIARVLRQRQSTTLHARAIAGLKTKFKKEMDAYAKIPPKEQSPTRKLRSLRLTAREYDLLLMVDDQLMGKSIDIGYPQVTSRGKEFVVVTYNIDYMEIALPEIDKL